MERSLVRLSRRLRTFSLCNNVLFQAETEQEMLQSICEILVAEDDFRLAWIGYCENDVQETVRPVARAGNELDYLDRVQTSWGDSEVGQNPVGIALRTGKPCWVNDVSTDPRFSHWRIAAAEAGYASCIGLPLIAHGKRQGSVDLSGALNLYSAEREFFDESTIEHYASLATYLTLAVGTLRGELAGTLTSGVTALRTSRDRKRAQDSLQMMRKELARVTRLMEMGQRRIASSMRSSRPFERVLDLEDADVVDEDIDVAHGLDDRSNLWIWTRANLLRPATVMSLRMK
jgi:hypothetical protein